MTDDDTAGPDASLLEDILELRLLTADDKRTGPIDSPVKDHRLDDLHIDVQIDDER
jgi:hypothetical protein